jgi:hypothetical protein
MHLREVFASVVRIPAADSDRAATLARRATPAALQNYRPFVFGEHALQVQQWVLVRGEPDRVIQERDLHVVPPQLMD